jgi:hypothetical protein
MIDQIMYNLFLEMVRKNTKLSAEEQQRLAEIKRKKNNGNDRFDNERRSCCSNADCN